jgi:predicted nucleic acid-binding protein
VGAVVLDSSVVLGILDPEDVHHPAAVAELRRRESAGDWFVIPSLVLAEVLVGVARAEPGALERRQRDLSSALDTARPLDEAVAVAAARLRARHRSLRMPDAIVIATGIVDEVDAILTADRRWAGMDPRVVVLSP